MTKIIELEQDSKFRALKAAVAASDDAATIAAFEECFGDKEIPPIESYGLTPGDVWTKTFHVQGWTLFLSFEENEDDDGYSLAFSVPVSELGAEIDIRLGAPSFTPGSPGYEALKSDFETFNHERAATAISGLLKMASEMVDGSVPEGFEVSKIKYDTGATLDVKTGEVTKETVVANLVGFGDDDFEDEED